ncbi:hypothetical protein CC2G_014772 [Coprinopsis cinerea AmutBmut pab1-1]|nr:hypothetical protein CC2G_014772 [Coprinopsis cinerea AmutBmut pab1-1]
MHVAPSRPTLKRLHCWKQPRWLRQCLAKSERVVDRAVNINPAFRNQVPKRLMGLPHADNPSRVKSRAHSIKSNATFLFRILWLP